MKITELQTDDAIIAEIGERLAARRVSLQLTQAALAEQAGIGKRTLERMEAGETAQLTSLVRVLRALDALAGLENLLPQTGPSPMDLLKRKGKARQRASGARAAKAAIKSAPTSAGKSPDKQSDKQLGKTWQWDDDA